MEKAPGKFDYSEVANELDKIQLRYNEGRGVRCVSAVVNFLKLGKVDEAKTVCKTDYDKMRNYPLITDYLISTIFKDDPEHPWSYYYRHSTQEEREKFGYKPTI